MQGGLASGTSHQVDEFVLAASLKRHRVPHTTVNKLRERSVFGLHRLNASFDSNSLRPGADLQLTKPLSRGAVARSLESCGVGLPADARRA